MASRGNVFDETLATAVARFQARCGHEPTGVAGPTELAALNVSALARLRQIELNMERWRWLPETFGDRYLIVNIPEYMLRIFDHDRPVLEMRVVVGKAMNAEITVADASHCRVQRS